MLNGLLRPKCEPDQSQEKEINFIQLVNRKGAREKNTSNVIRFRFWKPKQKQKNPVIMFYMGLEVAKHLNLSSHDKVKVFYDDIDHHLFLIKKSLHEKEGYKLNSKINPKNLVFQFGWPFSTPPSCFYKITEVSTEPYEDGLLIELPFK